MDPKLLVRGVATALTAAATVVGAVVGAGVGAGTGAGTTAATSASREFTPVVFGSPLPLEPPGVAVLPTAEQLSGVLLSLANPGVPFASKSYLVEGGIGRIEARTADALMRNAVAKGQLPLSFVVSDIAAAGPGAATALVTATGPATGPVSQGILFVDQGGWKLSRASASAVLAMFKA